MRPVARRAAGVPFFPMAVVWNITRAADEADALARELEAQGLRARSLPCIERRWLGWPDIPAGALLFLTSTAALPIPDEARSNPVAALAKVAEVLRREGRAVLVDSSGGVVSLASALAELWGSGAARERPRVLYPASDLAPREPEHLEAVARLARVADVTCHAAYRVVPPEALAQSLSALGADSGLVFFSPSAVRHFLAAAANTPAPRAVVVHGASTQRAWDEARPRDWPGATEHAREQPLADTLRRFS